MIVLLSLAIIGIVVYSMMREGLFNALCNLFGVVFSGTVSVHCWPGFANALEDSFAGSFLANYEDAISLLGVFALVLLLCRVLTNLIANRELDIPPQMSQIGGGCVGAVAGYLMAGFLVFALQTMPWDEKFLGYVSPPNDEQVHYLDERVHYITNKVFPPDQVWLKMMKRANETVFEDDDRETLKQDGLFSEFTYKYAKFRRLGPDGKPQELPKRPPPVEKKEPEKKEPEKKGPEKKDPEKKEPEKIDDRTPDQIPDSEKKKDEPK